MAFLRQELFKKPAWIYTEINTIIYWLHLWILAVVVLYGLQYFFGGDMFSWKNTLVSVPFLGVGDTIAHSVLKMR